MGRFRERTSWRGETLTYALFITNKVKKELRKVPKQPLNRIYEAIESLKKEPRPKGALKIKGNEGYRLRVGDYRILLILTDSVVSDKRASSDVENMGLWYRVAVTKTLEIFDISEIRFWKTTEATE
ncbi:MAG: hypothetical protein C5S48_05510 [Candidatus Methanogaster sp.]|nr:MAG: hypothetical protein C5S48_05510 [ANME-2 cluster archaeon]